MSSLIHLIYAGGTFGCHGTPLKALPSSQFLPAFAKLCPNVNVLDNPIVKDSSTLTPSDFVHFYQLIKTAHQNGANKFLLITGTDTLAYLSAFLTVGLKGLPLTLVVTGSMIPLFDPIITPLTKDTHSDAWNNLTLALDFFDKNIHGGFVSFYPTIFHGDSVQKIHKTDKNAFVGIPFGNAYPILNPLTINRLNTSCSIYSFYCMPNEPDVLADYLEFLANKSPTALIVQGFGAGNMPSSNRLIQAINTLDNKGFLLIMTSASPYGVVSTTYEAGAWQYEQGFVSAGHLTTPAIYAYALWLCLTLPIGERKQAWHSLFRGG